MALMTLSDGEWSFPAETLETLRQADAESHAEITRQFEAWDNVDGVMRRRKDLRSRQQLYRDFPASDTKILQQRAEQLGVAVLFRSKSPT